MGMAATTVQRALWGGLVFAVGCAGGESDGNDRFADSDASAGSDDGDSSDDDETPPRAGGDGVGDDDDDDDREVVPLDGPSEPYSLTCQARPSTSVVRGVSPNGDLWVAVPQGSDTVLTSFSGGGQARTWLVPFAEGAATAVRPWSATEAVVTGADGLWTFDDGDLDSIRWIDGEPAPIGLCGDASVEGDGFVLADDLYTRDLGQWWRWNLPGDPIASGDALAVVAGACAGPSDVAWLRRGTAVWSVTTSFVGAEPELEPSDGIAADDSFGVASLVGGDLVVLAEAKRTTLTFEAGAATSVSAAPGVLWTVAGDRLYRHIDGQVVEARRDDPGADHAAVAPDAIWADATGGAWLEIGDELCRMAPSNEPTVEVFGVRDYQRRRSDSLEATIVVSDGSTPSVSLDGEWLTATEASGTWTVSAQALPEGWHTLTIELDGGVSRQLRFAVDELVAATWEDDVVPLFEEHCAGAGCHGPNPTMGTQPDLATYEQWSALASTIDGRVVLTGDMPPLGARKESWGVDEVLLIAGWLDAGLPRNEE